MKAQNSDVKYLKVLEKQKDKSSKIIVDDVLKHDDAFLESLFRKKKEEK